VIEEAALLVPFFLAGAVLFYFSSRVRLNAWGALGAITLLGVLAIIRQVEALGALPLAYILLWAAVAAPRALQMVGSKHDFSYGMYLYAFPLQQMLVVVGIQRYGLLVFTLASMLLTMPLAMLSWFVVERPSLKLKSFRRTARRDPVSA
jgi:peptidoglycan/LPS O-acetylase OafA/YrhL